MHERKKNKKKNENMPIESNPKKCTKKRQAKTKAG